MRHLWLLIQLMPSTTSEAITLAILNVINEFLRLSGSYIVIVQVGSVAIPTLPMHLEQSYVQRKHSYLSLHGLKLIT